MEPSAESHLPLSAAARLTSCNLELQRHCDVLACRTTRKAEKGRDEQRKQLGLPEAVKLLPESEGDAQAAAMVTFGNSSSFVNNRYAQLHFPSAPPEYRRDSPLYLRMHEITSTLEGNVRDC